MEVEENSLDEWRSWFQCPACGRMVTGLVQKGHPHPEKGHAVYSHSHCCQSCERGGPHGEKWLCAGVPAALFQSVELNTTGVQQLQHYLLHDPGGPLRPVLLFLHGANTYIYPETLWWDLMGLVSNNQALRENFIIIAPFGSVGEQGSQRQHFQRTGSVPWGSHGCVPVSSRRHPIFVFSSYGTVAFIQKTLLEHC